MKSYGGCVIGAHFTKRFLPCRIWDCWKRSRSFALKYLTGPQCICLTSKQTAPSALVCHGRFPCAVVRTWARTFAASLLITPEGPIPLRLTLVTAACSSVPPQLCKAIHDSQLNALFCIFRTKPLWHVSLIPTELFYCCLQRHLQFFGSIGITLENRLGKLRNVPPSSLSSLYVLDLN